MSKLARERKKHWRVVKAIAKEQGIELLEPRKKYLPNYWYTLGTRPAPNFIPQSNKFFDYLKTMFNAAIFKPHASQIKFYGLDEENDTLRGLTLDNYIVYDEVNGEILDGGQIIQESIIYDKDKSKE